MDDSPQSVTQYESKLRSGAVRRIWDQRGRIVVALVMAGLVAQVIALRISLRKAREDHCRAGKHCTEPEECTASGWLMDEVSCRASSAHACGESKACKEQGDCGLRDGRCRPRGDEDCRASTSCTEEGRCTMVTFDDGSAGCHAKSDTDCKNSTVCKDMGWCRLTPDEICGP